MRAFTITELLVTFTVASLLLALAIMGYGSMIGRSRSSACIANLRAIGTALNAYLEEHNMIMPPLAAGRLEKSQDLPVIDNTLNIYADDDRIFRCPADRTIAEKSGTSYFWNSALSGQSAASLNLLLLTSDQSKIPVIMDKEGWHPGGKVNYLYADGSAESGFRLFPSD